MKKKPLRIVKKKPVPKVRRVFGFPLSFGARASVSELSFIASLREGLKHLAGKKAKGVTVERWGR